MKTGENEKKKRKKPKKSAKTYENGRKHMKA